MSKRVLIILISIVSSATFVSAIVAINRNEFRASEDSVAKPNGSLVFVPPVIRTESNDTEEVARAARGMGTGSFVVQENEPETGSTTHQGTPYGIYRVLAFAGYITLAVLLIVFGRA